MGDHMTTRLVPRPWWRPAHERIATALWSLRGGGCLVKYAPGTTIALTGPVTYSGRNLTIDGGRFIEAPTGISEADTALQELACAAAAHGGFCETLSVCPACYRAASERRVRLRAAIERARPIVDAMRRREEGAA